MRAQTRNSAISRRNSISPTIKPLRFRKRHGGGTDIHVAFVQLHNIFEKTIKKNKTNGMNEFNKGQQTVTRLAARDYYQLPNNSSKIGNDGRPITKRKIDKISQDSEEDIINLENPGKETSATDFNINRSERHSNSCLKSVGVGLTDREPGKIKPCYRPKIKTELKPVISPLIESPRETVIQQTSTAEIIPDVYPPEMTSSAQSSDFTAANEPIKVNAGLQFVENHQQPSTVVPVSSESQSSSTSVQKNNIDVETIQSPSASLPKTRIAILYNENVDKLFNHLELQIKALHTRLSISNSVTNHSANPGGRGGDCGEQAPSRINYDGDIHQTHLTNKNPNVKNDPGTLSNSNENISADGNGVRNHGASDEESTTSGFNEEADIQIVYCSPRLLDRNTGTSSTNRILGCHLDSRCAKIIDKLETPSAGPSKRSQKATEIPGYHKPRVDSSCAQIINKPETPSPGPSKRSQKATEIPGYHKPRVDSSCAQIINKPETPSPGPSKRSQKATEIPGYHKPRVDSSCAQIINKPETPSPGPSKRSQKATEIPGYHKPRVDSSCAQIINKPETPSAGPSKRSQKATEIPGYHKPRVDSSCAQIINKPETPSAGPSKRSQKATEIPGYHKPRVDSSCAQIINKPETPSAGPSKRSQKATEIPGYHIPRGNMSQITSWFVTNKSIEKPAASSSTSRTSVIVPNPLQKKPKPPSAAAVTRTVGALTTSRGSRNDGTLAASPKPQKNGALATHSGLQSPKPVVVASCSKGTDEGALATPPEPRNDGLMAALHQPQNDRVLLAKFSRVIELVDSSDEESVLDEDNQSLDEDFFVPRWSEEATMWI